MKISFCFLLLLLISGVSFAQVPHSHGYDRTITFPDIPGYNTLVTDLHIHTVFSDGKVWPEIRVLEAEKDGVHAIAMTEHLEYQPHKKDIPHPDRNRSFEVAKSAASAMEMMVISGTEITRGNPAGHSNAIFIEDANKMMMEDVYEVFKEANRQGAFVFWNHPAMINLVSDGMAKLTDLHKRLISEKLLHGIEVVNDLTYSEESLQIALDYNLTIMGTSDIHELIDWRYKVPEGGHRPVTLVFANDKTEQGLEEALRRGRTVAWFNDLLIGKEENVQPLLKACLTVEEAAYLPKSQVARVVIKNNSSSSFTLRSTGNYTYNTQADVFTIQPHASLEMEVKTLEVLDSFTMEFEVLNAVIAPKKHPVMRLSVEISN